MAKRSREDFEPISPESDPAGDASDCARSVIHPSTINIPSSTSKFLHLGPGSGEGLATEMRCSLPPHRGTLTFASFEEYDVHYAKTHTNRCLECRKNFPTDHFLNLHIEENHDALVSVRKERGEKTVSIHVPGYISFYQGLILYSMPVSSRTVTGCALLLKSDECTWSTNICSPRTMTST